MQATHFLANGIIIQSSGQMKLIMKGRLKILKFQVRCKCILTVACVCVFNSGGYGKGFFTMMRKMNDREESMIFPLMLGRDFSGVVIQTGQGVNRLKPGDEVKYCHMPRG